MADKEDEPNNTPTRKDSNDSSSSSISETSETSNASLEVDDDDSDGAEMTVENVSILDLLDPYAMSTQIRKRINHTVRQKGEQVRNRVVKMQRGAEDLDMDKVRTHFNAQMDKFAERMSSEQLVSLGEKLTFAASLLNIFFIGYVVGAVPEKFHIMYTIESFLLLPYRVFTYKRKNYHYFLADLCYFANFIILLFIWVFPQSQKLYICCYAFSFGTLSWAVITWRNSLVLHSVDKTTSTFIHVFPPVVFHVITHCLSDQYKKTRFPGAMQGSWKITYGIVWTSVAYFVWQSLYHYFITHRRKEKIKAGRVTSFEYLRKHTYKNTRAGQFVNGLPEPWGVVVFTAVQYSFQFFSMMLCPIWFSSKVLSTVFLTGVMFTACYNGATYYLDIFGKRFQKELVRLQEQMAEYDRERNSNSSTYNGSGEEKKNA